MANFLNLLLLNNYAVKHIAISTEKHPFKLDNYPKEIRDKTNPEAVCINTKVTPLKAISALFKSGSYNINRFFNNDMNQLLSATLRETKFDIIILESIYSSPYLESLRQSFDGKIFIRSHNVEHQIWEDLSKNTSNVVKRWYLNKLGRDLKTYELHINQTVDGIMTISKDDESYFKAQNSDTNITTIPFTVVINDQLQNSYSGNNIFHIGGMDWDPNREAVNRLIKLFPSIQNSIPTIQLSLIGKGTEALHPTEKQIQCMGFVPDLSTFCIQTGILVSPITSGSGVRIKILEMMALGIPIITTNKGAQGINPDQVLYIANSNEELIEAIVKLTHNKEIRIDIGQNAQNYIRENHAPSVIAKQLNEFLQRT